MSALSTELEPLSDHPTQPRIQPQHDRTNPAQVYRLRGTTRAPSTSAPRSSCDGKRHLVKRIEQTWSRRLSMVRLFAQWLHSLEPKHEVPPRRTDPLPRGPYSALYLQR